MLMLRRAAAVVAGSVLLLSACGGTPSKADFVDKIEGTVGDDLSSVLEQQGVDAAQLDDLIKDFVGCQYDALADDEDLLRKAYDNPGDADIQTQIDIKATDCVSTLTAGLGDAAGNSTATTLPAPGTPTTLPTADAPDASESSVPESSTADDPGIDESTDAPQTTAP